MKGYAKALMDVAIKDDALDEITYQLDELDESFMTNKGWIKMMNSPMYTKDQKFALIDQLNLHKDLANLIKILAKTKRMDAFEKLYTDWTLMVRQKQNIAHVNVYTVAPLTKNQLENLTKSLQPRFKDETVELHVEVDESLIGGLKIIYHGQSIDHTVLRELEELFYTI